MRPVSSPVTALIVAAGSGSRMGGGVPKQYRLLGGKSVLANAVDALAGHPRIDNVRVVIGIGQQALAREALGNRDVGEFIIGGDERTDSVRAGLAAIGDGIVLVHDAARPFCPPDVIDRLLDGLTRGDGAVPVIAVADTLGKGVGTLDAMVDRSGLVRVQTPQAFHAEDILYALGEVRGRTTDESSVMVAAGLKVIMVEGDAMLDKLTTAADWARAQQRLAAAMVSRTGSGFDVHAFGGDGTVAAEGMNIESRAGAADHRRGKALLGPRPVGGSGQFVEHRIAFHHDHLQSRRDHHRAFVGSAAAHFAERIKNILGMKRLRGLDPD